MRACLASLLFALVAIGCKPIAAPGVPQDFQRGGPIGSGMDVGPRIARDSGPRDATFSDAAERDASQLADAAIDDANAPDDGVGCAFVECMPGSLCCAFDGRCYDVSCFDCCSFITDAGPDAR